jgi:hypothetical protein
MKKVEIKEINPLTTEYTYTEENLEKKCEYLILMPKKDLCHRKMYDSKYSCKFLIDGTRYCARYSLEKER